MCITPKRPEEKFEIQPLLPVNVISYSDIEKRECVWILTKYLFSVTQCLFLHKWFHN